MIQLPPFPTAPGPGATAEDRASFYDQVAAYDLLLRTIALQQAEAAQATREAHAIAQAETAAAMRASVVAQTGFTAAMREPDPLPPLAAQKRAAVIQLLSTQARGNRKPATFVADAQAQVDAVFAVLAGGAA